MKEVLDIYIIYLKDLIPQLLSERLNSRFLYLKWNLTFHFTHWLNTCCHLFVDQRKCYTVFIETK